MSDVDAARAMLRAAPIGAAAIYQGCCCGAQILVTFPTEAGNQSVIAILQVAYDNWHYLHKPHAEKWEE